MSESECENMHEDIKKRIASINHNSIPEGFKRTKQGVLPKDWKKENIANILSKVGEPVVVEPNKQYVQIGIRSHGKGLFYKEPVSGKELGNKAVFWIEPNCFVVNIVFAWEQAIGITSEKEIGLIGSHRFPMYSPVKDKVTIEYLLNFFMTLRGKEILEDASPGGAGRNKTLGQERFKKSEIILPPIIEQKKIVDILSHCDKVIALKQQLIVEEYQCKKHLQNMCFSNNSVEQKNLSSLAKIVMGQSPDSKTYNLLKKGLPLIQGNADINNRMACPKRYTTFPGKTCEVNDIIMSVRAPVGIVARTGIKACIGRGVCAIQSDDFSEYIYQYLLFIEDRWSKVSQGSTFGSVSGDEISKINVPIVENVKAVTEAFIAVDHTINLLEQELTQWQQKKKALMQLLLTGIVRVPV